MILENLKNIVNGTEIEIFVRVEENMCQILEENWMFKLSFGTKIALYDE